MHYYTHHIGDFLRDAGHLTNEQLGVYMKMLWRYYLNQKPLENDPESLAFAVGADEKIVQQILRHFFSLTEEGWRQPRCDREIANFQNKSQKARHSANARWSNANAYQTHTERSAIARKNDANQEPITNNQEPLKKREPRKRDPVLVRPDDVSEQTWNDWMVIRKTKKAAVTKTAIDCIRREALKAGITLDGALSISCARGWQSFKADWIKKDHQPKSFAQQEREEGWRRWEEMTGRQHPDRLRHEGISQGMVIDVQSGFLEIEK